MLFTGWGCRQGVGKVDGWLSVLTPDALPGCGGASGDFRWYCGGVSLAWGARSPYGALWYEPLPARGRGRLGGHGGTDHGRGQMVCAGS